ncbi:MAG: hypothetical protein KatS3mg114_1140 [Planctomycetaceae bacterium]|nr:MAG: hypothetical protein KatS3mg114_1140 [Planctomycetaceae bacterium]
MGAASSGEAGFVPHDNSCNPGESTPDGFASFHAPAVDHLPTDVITTDPDTQASPSTLAEHGPAGQGWSLTVKDPTLHLQPADLLL